MFWRWWDIVGGKCDRTIFKEEQEVEAWRTKKSVTLYCWRKRRSEEDEMTVMLGHDIDIGKIIAAGFEEKVRISDLRI